MLADRWKRLVRQLQFISYSINYTSRNKPRAPTCLSANVVRVRTSVRGSLANAIVYHPSMGDINTPPKKKQPSPQGRYQENTHRYMNSGLRE